MHRDTELQQVHVHKQPREVEGVGQPLSQGNKLHNLQRETSLTVVVKFSSVSPQSKGLFTHMVASFPCHFSPEVVPLWGRGGLGTRQHTCRVSYRFLFCRGGGNVL